MIIIELISLIVLIFFVIMSGSPLWISIYYLVYGRRNNRTRLADYLALVIIIVWLTPFVYNTSIFWATKETVALEIQTNRQPTPCGSNNGGRNSRGNSLCLLIDTPGSITTKDDKRYFYHNTNLFLFNFNQNQFYSLPLERECIAITYGLPENRYIYSINCDD